MTVARREHFGLLLEPGLRKIFYNEYAELPSMIKEIFNVQSTDKAYEKDGHIGAMNGFPKFQGTVEYSRMYEGYTKTYEFPEYASGFQIERKAFDDAEYGIINKQPVGLAIEATRTREEHAAEIFNNAITNTDGFDGKALIATDHPTKAPDGPSERSNRHALELNHANLQTVKTAMRKTKNDRGNQIAVVPDVLLVPVDLEEEAYQLVTSPGVLGQHSADTNPSIHHGRLKVIVWDSLSNAKSWFLIDSKYSKLFLNWFDRVPIEFAWAEDFDTLVAKYRAYMRYEAGWSDWVWVAGSNPDWA